MARALSCSHLSKAGAPLQRLLAHVAVLSQVANALRKEHNIPLDYIAIDWHEMDRQLGSNGIVEAFWQTVRTLLTLLAPRRKQDA